LKEITAKSLSNTLDDLQSNDLIKEMNRFDLILIQFALI